MGRGGGGGWGGVHAHLLYILKVQKSNGDVVKLIESLLLLPVNFLIIWQPMKMHDSSNIENCG